MKYLNYLLIPVVLFTAHFFAGPWVMIIIWCCLGVLLGVASPVRRFPLLPVLIAEIFVFLCYWFFVADRHGSLYPLAEHAGIEPLKMAAAVLCVNIITALLCTGVGFSLTKKLMGKYPA